MKEDSSRRRFLRRALFGTGAAGLSALATGLPLSFFTKGFPTPDAMAAPDGAPRKFLILISGSAGDPFNINAPGSYQGLEGMLHNPNPEMAPVSLRLGATDTQAAAPWATLPQWVLDQTSFIHHRTYQNSHPQFAKVLGLVGSAKAESGSGSEQIGSVYSSENAEALQTIQVEPISLSGGLRFQGRALQSLRPSTLSLMFGEKTGQALELEELRASTLDSIHAVMHREGTPEQRRWLDRYTLSHEQVRQLDEQLLSRFSNISDNGSRSQIDAALTLVMMKVSPVVRIQIPFGGDNHADAGFVKERDEAISGLDTLKYLFEQIDSLGLREHVIVANLHVFGRTFRMESRGGRQHNLNHHVMMISGTNVNPGIVGGIVPTGKDFGATAIDSVTGQGAEGADIPVDQTLESAAKTLGTILGMPSERIDRRIEGGKVIQSVMRDT